MRQTLYFITSIVIVGCNDQKADEGQSPAVQTRVAATAARSKSDVAASPPTKAAKESKSIGVGALIPTEQQVERDSIRPIKPSFRENEAEGNVVAEGVGLTPDEALKDAFRNAVRQVVGSYVNTESQIKDDQIITDDVLTYSDGFIEHYEEVESRTKEGMCHTTIRAMVERQDVLSCLRSANVAVESVDGKGLFAMAVTTLESERAAERMLQRIFKEYPSTVLDVVVVSAPRIIDKSDQEAKVSYDIRVSIDRSKYDQLFRRVIPLMERSSVRHGTYNNIGEPRSPESINNNFAIQFGMPFQVRYGNAPDYRKTVEVVGSHLLFAGDLDYKQDEFRLGDIDFRTQMLVLVNTGRDKSDGQTDWKWFHMPKANIFPNNVVIEVHFEGSHYKDEFMFGRSNSGPALPGICLEADEFRSRYTGPWKSAVLSPYFLQTYTNVDYATEMTWTVERSLTLKELQQVRSLKCNAKVRRPTSKSKPTEEKWDVWEGRAE